MSGKAERRFPAMRMATCVFLLVALVFVGLVLWKQWGAFRGVGPGQSGFRWRFSPGWLTLALGVATADLFWMAGVWVRLFRAAGGRCSYREGIAVWMGTNLGRYIPGKVWQLSGLAVYMRARGRSGAAALSAAVAFQLLTIGTGVAVAAATLGTTALRLPGGAVTGGLALVVMVGVLLHPAVLHRASRLGARWLKEEADVSRIRVRTLAAAAVGLVVAWGGYGVGLWCLLRGTVAGGIPGGVLPLTGAFAGSYVAGYVVLISPGGLVAREGALAGFLGSFGGLPLAAAAAVALLARVWTTTSELAGLALAAAARRGGDTGEEGR